MIINSAGIENEAGFSLRLDSKGNRFLFEYSIFYGMYLRQIDFNGKILDCSSGVEFQNLAREAGLTPTIQPLFVLFNEYENNDKFTPKF